MSTTFEIATLWRATPLATDQSKIGAAGLSIRQRKILTLLAEPMSAAQLASSLSLPLEDVNHALDRFAKLGFAQSVGPASAPFNPMQLRTTFGVQAAAGESSSRTPLIFGVSVAALALVAAAAWTLRGSSGASSAPTPTASNATAAQQKAPTPTGPADSADSAQPRSTASPTSARAPTLSTLAPLILSAPAAKVAPTTAADAAAARAAAANTAAAAAAEPPAPAPKKAGSTAATPAAASTAAADLAANALAALRIPATALASSGALTPATASVPTPAATTTASAAAAAPPIPALPVPTPTVALPTAVATNTPARLAPAAAREIKLVTRVEPQFPRGFDDASGTVRARLRVDSLGTVTGVEIVEANPPRVFDRNVRSALQQWRYEPTGEAFSTMAEIKFNR